jgi:hypothetical protein
MATQEEKQAYIDDMARRRGYVLGYHKGMAAARLGAQNNSAENKLRSPPRWA